MQVGLNEDLVSRLLEWPEDGMGYQRVDLILADGRVIRDVVVFNAEVASIPNSYRPISTMDIVDAIPVKGGLQDRSQ